MAEFVFSKVQANLQVMDVLESLVWCGYNREIPEQVEAMKAELLLQLGVLTGMPEVLPHYVVSRSIVLELVKRGWKVKVNHTMRPKRGPIGRVCIIKGDGAVAAVRSNGQVDSYMEDEVQIAPLADWLAMGGFTPCSQWMQVGEEFYHAVGYKAVTDGVYSVQLDICGKLGEFRDGQLELK